MRWIWVVLVVAACGDGGGDGDCRDGETRTCYTGPAGTLDVGECTAGVETCVDGKFPGICIGDVTPFVEHCDGLDEDCSGTVDDVAEAGATCLSADGCEGAKACVGADLGCVAPKRNACDVCGGTEVTDVGTACTLGNCSGQRVCNLAGDGTDCNAPAANECALCGGPPVAGLGADCTAISGCSGINVCNGAGDGAVCDCNPEPGLCRDGTAFRPVVAPIAGDLVITEVMPSPSGDDNFQEWFEVEVIHDVDLNELQLDRARDTLAPVALESVDCLRVTAGTRLVFAKSADPAVNGGLPAVFATFNFALVAGSAASPGDVQLLAPGGGLVDAITWTASTSTKARQLDPGAIDPVANDDESKFCNATTSYNGGSDFGTPGAANAACPIVIGPGQCLAGGTTVRGIVKPAVGDLVITEVLPNPAGTGTDTTQEFFEIRNVSGAPFDLNGLGSKSLTSSVELVPGNDCITVAPGAFAIFAHTADTVANAGLPRADVLFGFALANSNGGVSVVDGATVLDAITWATSVDGASRTLAVSKLTAADNDVEANFCTSTSTYGTAANKGSPDALDNACP